MKHVVTAILAAGLLGIVSTSAQAAELGKTFDEILQGAKAEGKLVIWSPLPAGHEGQQAALDAFNERFGLHTEFEWVPLAAAVANTRAFAEAAGGKLSVDIIGSPISYVVSASGDGLISPFDWEGIFGTEFPEISKVTGMAGFKDFALQFARSYYGLAYNTDMMTESEVPTTLAAMMDPKWSGKFSANASFLVPLDLVSLCIGEDEVLKLVDGLLANQPVLGKGTAAVNQAISIGQVPFGMTIGMVASGSIRKGEPLKFVMPTDYVTTNDLYAYALNNSPNPNTARLFLAWYATEGTKVIDPIEPLTGPLDTETEYSQMARERIAAGAKVCEITSEADVAAIMKVREEIGKKLSGQ